MSALAAPASPEAPPPTPEPAYRTVVVEGTDPAQAQRDVDAKSPGFATAIDLEDERGARPSDSLPEALGRVAGVTVRSVGGLGQFSAVSLRGSTPQQVAIFLDGVPVGDSVGGLVDVGAIPLDALGRAEVYRGHVPVQFGGAAMGGAIDLVSGRAPRTPQLDAWAGFGSFLARQAGVSGGGPLGRKVRAGATVGYAGTRGDFPYFDDNGTPQTPDDDGTAIRSNNHYDRVLAQAHVEARPGPVRVRVQQWAAWKRQGIPGTANVQSERTSLDTLTLRTSGNVRHDRWGRPGSRVEWVASVGAQRRLFSDPDNEVGVFADDELTWAVDGYLSPRLRLPVWKNGFIALVADQRSEWVRVEEREGDVGSVDGDATRTRFRYGAGVELQQFAFQDRLSVVPIFRVDALDSRFAVDDGAGEFADEGRDSLDVGLAPRIGSRLRVGWGVQLRASGGRYFRPPTLLEMFGDRGYIVGNEGLVSERGWSVDGGVVAEPPLGNKVALRAHVACFGSWSEDLIQWVQAGTVSRAVNVAGAQTRGLESSLLLDLYAHTFRVQANYTFLDTENLTDEASQQGQPLPGRPRHELFARADAGYEWGRDGKVPWEPRVLYTVEHIAGTYLDPSGRRQVPARTIHGAGVELHLARRVHLAVEVRNLLDLRVTTWNPPIQGVGPLPVPVSDFIGFPLPGRSVWATARVDLSFARRDRPSSTDENNS